MPPIAVEKYVSGYFYNAAEEPIVGVQIPAVLNSRIVDQGDNKVMSHGTVLSEPTGDEGLAIWHLHPNNLPGDSPLNSWWEVTEPSGEKTILFIPHDHALGGSIATAIPYTSLITLPTDLPAPEESDLDDRITELEVILDNLLAANSAGLAAIPVATTLVDAALAAAVDATSTNAGRMTAAYASKLDGLDGSTYAKLNTAKTAVKFPATTRPGPALPFGEAWGYLNSATGEAELALSVAGVNFYTILGPPFDSPAFQLSADVSVTSTSFQNINSTGIPVAANALYFIYGPIHYVAQGNYNVGFRFTNIPSGATLRWSGLGLATPDTVPSAAGVGKIDARVLTGTNELLVPGQGTTPLFTGQGTPGSVTVFVYGTLRTGSNPGAVTLQARQDIRSSGGTVNPQILAGTSITLQRN